MGSCANTASALGEAPASAMMKPVRSADPHHVQLAVAGCEWQRNVTTSPSPAEAQPQLSPSSVDAATPKPVESSQTPGARLDSTMLLRP